MVKDIKQEIYTVFNNEGKLLQVEYAIKAVKQSSISNISIKNNDTVVMVSQKLIEDLMMDSDYQSNFSNVSNDVGIMTLGLNADKRSLISRYKQESFEFRQEYGFTPSADIIAQRMSCVTQQKTMQTGMRVLAVDVVIAGYDAELGPLLYKIDPAGFCAGYKALCCGVKEDEGNNCLEKLSKEKDFNSLSDDELIRTAIEALQNTLGMDFKLGDIEVAVIGKRSQRFRKLSDTEIKDHLQILNKLE